MGAASTQRTMLGAPIGTDDNKSRLQHWLSGGSSTIMRGTIDKLTGLSDGNYGEDQQFRKADENQEAYDKWLAMLQGKIEGSGYDFLAPKTTTQTGHTETKATFNPEAQPLVSKLSALYKDRLENPTGLPEGYLGSVARGTNDAYQGAQVAANNLAARRGLSGEQAVSIGEPIEAARAGKIADVANNMPILGRQLQNEDMQMAQAFSDMLKGSITDSRGTTTAPADIGDYLAYLGMLQPYQKPIIVPGAKTDNTGTYVGAGASVVAAIVAAL